MAQQKTTSTTASARMAQARSRRNQRTLVIGFAIVCVLGLVVFGVRIATRPAATTADRADVANTALVQKGQRVYTTYCASCHGGDLKGEPGWPQRRSNGVMPAAPLDASGPAWQRSDPWLFTTIKQGGQATAAPGTSSFMPALGGGLTDAEIWAVISYIKSTWPQHVQDSQPLSLQPRR